MFTDTPDTSNCYVTTVSYAVTLIRLRMGSSVSDGTPRRPACPIISPTPLRTTTVATPAHGTRASGATRWTAMSAGSAATSGAASQHTVGTLDKANVKIAMPNK